MKTTIYKANPKTHFFKELGTIIKDIKSSQFLAKQMAKRDIQAQYRQSFFGFMWALAPVISQTAIWTFLNKSTVVKFGETQIPYPLFALIGITVWTIFTDAVRSPIDSINQSKSIISKLNFPKEGLLVAGVYKFLFDAGIKLIFVVLIMAFYQILPGQSIIFFPIVLLATMLFGLAIGVIIAPIGLLYTDVARGISIVLSFLMFLAPVVYPEPKSGSLTFLFNHNPMTALLVSARNSLTGFSLYEHQTLIWIIPLSLILLAVGLVVFRNSMNILIERIS